MTEHDGVDGPLAILESTSPARVAYAVTSLQALYIDPLWPRRLNGSSPGRSAWLVPENADLA